MTVTYVPLEKLIKEMRAGTVSPGPAKPCLEHLIKEFRDDQGTAARRKVQLVPRTPSKSSADPDAGSSARKKIEYVGRNDPEDGPSKDGSLPVSTSNHVAVQAAVRGVIGEADEWHLTVHHPSNTKTLFQTKAKSHEIPGRIDSVRTWMKERGHSKMHVTATNSSTGEVHSHSVLSEESPLDDVQKFVARIRPGFGNPVDLEPRTDDKPVSNEREDASAKKARKQQNAAIGATNTVKEDEELEELFNQPYPTTKRTEPGLTVSSFKTDRGNPYEITVANQGRQAHVSFEHPEHGMSKADAPIEPGSAHRVFGTVKDTVLDHAKRHPDTKFISLSASGDEPSRIKLYHHIAKSIDKNYIHRVNDSEDHDFHARNPHYVTETLAADSALIDPVTKKNKGLATKLQGFSKIINRVSHNSSGAALREGGVDEAMNWRPPTAPFNRRIGPRIEMQKISTLASLRRGHRLSSSQGSAARVLAGKVVDHMTGGTGKSTRQSKRNGSFTMHLVNRVIDHFTGRNTTPGKEPPQRSANVGVDASPEEVANTMRGNVGKRDPYAKAMGTLAVKREFEDDPKKPRAPRGAGAPKTPPSGKQQQRAQASGGTFDNRHVDPGTQSRVDTVAKASAAAQARILKKRAATGLPDDQDTAAAREGAELRRKAGFSD